MPEISRNDRGMLTIRPTRIDDAFSVSVCISHVARERHFITAISGFNPLSTRNYLQFIQKKGGIHFVALDGNAIVGWCDVIPGMFEDLVNVGRLSIGLLPEYRRKGLGKLLLSQVIETTFKSFIERIELEVFASNLAAIGLYRSTGFREVRKKTNGHKTHNQVEDILLFGLFREEWQAHEAMVY
jgi:ribosomal protein S18 acetylase RimI-like enzyme